MMILRRYLSSITPVTDTNHLHNRVTLLSAASRSTTSAMIAASIEWHEVERTLVATSSDVLVIFDCCRAGLLCRSAQEGLENNDRIFQCLGACESEQRTRSSGKQSFTTAMIWALEELAKEPSFPVTKLVKKIEAHAGFPHDDQRPVLFGGRFAPASANIHLARMPSLVPNGH